MKSSFTVCNNLMHSSVPGALMRESAVHLGFQPWAEVDLARIERCCQCVNLNISVGKRKGMTAETPVLFRVKAESYYSPGRKNSCRS